MTAPLFACNGCRDGAEFPIPFSMAFQPIVDIRTGKPFAYEALVRGVAGEDAPTVLDVVNDNNRYGFDQGCRVKAIEGAMAAGLMETDAKLSINFLPNAVYSPVACIQLTLKTARQCGMPLDRLIFEFTEDEQMISPLNVKAIIDAYKQMGFGVAIDDFGAGHAGLDLFAHFAPDMVKIDMDLVRDIDGDHRRQAIVRGIVAMCAELETTVIGEGIETRAECDTLVDLGISYMQGFLFARPGFECLPAITL